MVVFRIRGKREMPISIRADEGERLVRTLHAQATATSGVAAMSAGSAAGMVAQGVVVGEKAPVELVVGEEDAVLEALGTLEAEGGFGSNLERLKRTLVETGA